MTALLYLVFVFSGAAGLIYESVWSRYLGLFVGHSAYAQIIVLVIFLGGMALGAVAVGRRSEKLREPLVWYAGIEIAVGLIGLIFHDVFQTVTRIAYDSIFPAMPGAVSVIIMKWLIAALLILPQSILLGATFPLMSAGVLRLLNQVPGRVLALLYFSNSIGAAVGVLVAGFYLIGAAGLPGTLIAAAIINLAVGLTIIVANRLWGFELADTADHRAREQTIPNAVKPEPAARDPLLTLLLAVSFGTAAASFIYEIAWIRMLSLVLGSATHSFELMLSAFILGLALGAFWLRTRADHFSDPIRALGIVQWAMGTLAIATLPVYLMSFHWTLTMFRTFGITEAGYEGFAVARYLICLAVMLPATFCAGITLPLITRMLVTRSTGERAIGLVYGFNTFGSIVGAALAGLVLMPLIGVKALLVVGAVIDMGLGVALLLRAQGRWFASSRLAPAMGFASLLIIAGVTYGARFDQVLLAHGVYRARSLPKPGLDSVIYYQDGRTATVSALRTLPTGAAYIATNGKPDASVSGDWLDPKRRSTHRRQVGGDETTQILAGVIPLAYKPDARNAAVIGHGSGMSSHMMLASPTLEELVTIDIEPAMIEGSRVFYPSNRRVFDDPRSHFVIDDAKAYFSSGHRKFDVILSEPSNPWVSGVSGLFTTEFYARVRNYLTDDGIFAQWLHLYEISDDLVLNVLAALNENFPSYDVYLVSRYDILVIAGKGPQLRRPDWRMLSNPALTQDLEHLLPIDVEAVEGSFLADRAAFAPLLEQRITPNSDFYPVLDLGTERTRYMLTRADGFARFTTDRFDLVSAIRGRRSPLGVTHVGAFGLIPRVQANGLSSRLRSASRGEPMDTLPKNPVFDVMHFRQRSLEAYFASKLAPSDWYHFVTLALDVERDVHGGAAGVADESFYGPLFSYMKAVKAPAGAVAAISYSYALAKWDWHRALAAGDTLMRQYSDTTEWVPVDFLRDGLIVAQLRLGDPIGARRISNALARRARSSESLRSMMLESYLVAAERESATALRSPTATAPIASAPRQPAAVAGPVSAVPLPAPARRTATVRIP
jgi:predicted membrane-bound spermidine synthase